MSGAGPPADGRLRLALLVLRCQVGDEAAFAELLGQFAPRTLRYLEGLVGDAAEDVQQEVWLAVYRGLAGLADPTAFRTWLFRTTRHRAIDHLRRLRRERELFVADGEEQLAAVAENAELPPVPGDLGPALAALAPIHREVLQLRFVDQLSYAEIALVTGCPLGTVRSRLHVARERLRRVITDTTTAPHPSGGASPGDSHDDSE